MRSAVVSLLAVSVAAAVACRSASQTSTPSAAPAPGPTTAQAPGSGAPGGPGGPGARPRPSPAAMDSMRRGMVARMLGEIAGKENLPAEQVYKNIKIWKGLPARALLDTMNSYGRAIGATCTGCHVAGQWDQDTRKNKVIARQMQRMTDELNRNALPKITELDEDRPPVTCAMCHAGSGHPRKDVPLTPGAPAGPPPTRPPGH